MIIKPRLGSRPIVGHWASRDFVGCYIFNEAGGSKTFDLSGHNNHVTLAAGSSWTPGKYGVAIDNSIDNYGTADESISLSFGGGYLTVAYSYLHRTTNDAFAYKFIKGGSTNYIRNTGETSNVGGYIYDGSNVPKLSVAYTQNLNQWYDVVIVYDLTSDSTVTCYFYVDGKYIGTDSDTVSGLGFDNCSLQVLANNQDDGLDGIANYFMIWNRALSAGEIAELYRNPFCMFQIEPIELWAAATAAAAPSTAGAMTLNTGYWGPTI